MRWCTERGLPHSTILNWDPEDRAKLHASLLEESLRCQMCGTAEWEWDPEQGGSKYAYAPMEHFCNGCYIKEMASEDNDSPKGTTIQLVPYSDAVIEKQRQAYQRQRTDQLKERRRGRRL